MKSRTVYPVIAIAIALLIIAGLYRCSSPSRLTTLNHADTIFTNINGLGVSIELDFLKGEGHNHPLMAVWIEDTSGKYIETLFVAESIGKGVFAHGKESGGKWQQGPLRRPAALPYWSHKRGIREDDGYYIPTPDNPLPDAITGR